MEDTKLIRAAIEAGKTYLGLELGSTRIKAVLMDSRFIPVAEGSHTWENKLIDGVWTYSLDEIWNGVRDCYAKLLSDVERRYGVVLASVGAMGVSGMMHGYMVFGEDGALLTPFRTWRNTITGQAAAELTQLFGFNIPQRWSIAHLYQAMLNGEEHVPRVAYMTTLAGYIHWKLTGRRVVGIGEASGMFPVCRETGTFDAGMMDSFNRLAESKGFGLRLEHILPRVLMAGENAGTLTKEGAALLDPSGTLRPGIPLCPPEGDAGTGMTATNSVAENTGNVSAGTSIFAMVVLDKNLKKVYPEIDIVATPSGEPVAMVHCNNCTSDLDAWVSLFGEFATALGAKAGKNEMYELAFSKALQADDGGDKLLAYNYYTGEPVTGIENGRPLFVRLPDSRLTLANFMRTQLFTALGALKIGMDLLLKDEGVRLEGITGHGGFFKVSGVGQTIMASALETPVTVMHTAGEGGPWGMAILAAYMSERQPGEKLADYLKHRVFVNSTGVTVQPDSKISESFRSFMQLYKKGLDIERTAVSVL